jgi:putative oxidoreductase
MPGFVQGILSLVGRVLLCAIFLLSAVGHDIPQYKEVVGQMEKAGVPQPQILLGGAIAFLILGSVLVIVGWWARLGALLLLIFLVLATYYFHNFWTLPEGSRDQQDQMAHFMKNAALAGAMLLIMGSGPGRWSVDALRRRTTPS